MDVRNELKYILGKEAITLTQMAQLMTEKTGRKYSVNSLSGKLLRQSISLKETADLLDTIGYHIEFVKNKTN
ncbi:hypothetical protein J6A64_07650 [bacterium]|nr:hypothetical protein [bacterium]MBO5447486.1 hypothetical protein [bacterium]